MRRLAVLSDIHGNLPALQAVLEEVEREGVDAVVDLGDSLSGPLWPCETAKLLMAAGWPAIAGNHERQLLMAKPPSAADAFAAAALTPELRNWLAARPPTLTLDVGNIWLIHGTPASDNTSLMETVTPDFGVHGSVGIRAATHAELRSRLPEALRASLLLCGHSHVPRVVMLDGLLIVNPGSVGQPAYDHVVPHTHRVETGSPHARWALVERGRHGWQAQLRLTAYDWDRAAARARANGRGDWADALETGRVGRIETDPMRASGG